MTGRYGQQGPQSMNGVRTTSDLHLAWDVPYEPGTLKAVGTKNGQAVVTVEIATTGDPAAIQLLVDRDTIRADRRDVAHIMVKVVDAQGRVHPDADNDITFEIQGEGKLIGLDNGDMSNQQDFKGKARKAYHGMCLAIVQSSGKPGQIRITATSPGLKSSAVTVATKA
jgi:beta-galactosidase